MTQNKSAALSTSITLPGSFVKEIVLVQNCVAEFKKRVKEFYFRVLLSQYECPDCRGKLIMTGVSECICSLGHVFDPTITFQRSRCCGTELDRKTFHYICSRCSQIVPSGFLFDERLFDNAYFREMMQESRAREKKKRDELKKLLAESRSNALTFLEEPVLDSIPGLTDALDAFVGTEMVGAEGFCYKTSFSLSQYRDHILSMIGLGGKLFSALSPIIDDFRKDKAWRFITLVFMEQDGEVTLTQYGQDLWVERFNHEAYA